MQQLFFCTVFLESRYGDGATATGTGFVYRVRVTDDSDPAKPPEPGLFLVTNKHVVEGAESVSLQFVAGEDREFTSPRLGASSTTRLHDPGQFVGHPDPDIDVAVCPISDVVRALQDQGRAPYFKTISDAMAAGGADQEAVDAIEQVTFIGYPNGLFDQVNFLPIARRGYTATPPTVDYGGKPMFLIDASVFPGSSGSPVLIAETQPYRLIMLGILAAVYKRDVPVLSAASAPHIEDLIDIGIVYKVGTIHETIDVVLQIVGLTRVPPAPGAAVETASPGADPLASRD